MEFCLVSSSVGERIWINLSGASLRSRQMALLILLIALATVYSGAELNSKYICSGESVILFRNISLDIINTVASLYVNGDNKTLIAMWMRTISKIADNYTGKVFLDPEGNVWIRNVNTGDEAKYIILHEIGGTSRNQYEVKLIVLVAPTTNCKSTIKHVDNTLIASLQGSECGKPAASVHFVQYADTSYENNTVAILYPEQETGTYTACMETAALRCRSFSDPFDFCTYFIFHNRPKNQEGSTSTNVVIITAIVPTSLVLFFVVECMIRRGVFRRHSTNESRHNARSVSQSRHHLRQVDQQAPVNGEHELYRMIS